MPSQAKYGLADTGETGTFEVSVPSGNICLVRSAGIEDLVAAGVLDQADQLTGSVIENHTERVLKGKLGKAHKQAAQAAEKESQLKAVIEIMRDKARWSSIQSMMDAVVARCTVAPQVHPVPPEGQGREPGRLYIDRVMFADKVAVFTAIMQSSNDAQEAMQPFRAGRQADVVDVDALKELQSSPERDAGSY